MVMVKQKKCSVEDTNSIKVSFMQCLKKTRTMLRVAFEEFGVVHMFFATFLFSL